MGVKPWLVDDVPIGDVMIEFGIVHRKGDATPPAKVFDLHDVLLDQIEIVDRMKLATVGEKACIKECVTSYLRTRFLNLAQIADDVVTATTGESRVENEVLLNEDIAESEKKESPEVAELNMLKISDAVKVSSTIVNFGPFQVPNDRPLLEDDAWFVTRCDIMTSELDVEFIGRIHGIRLRLRRGDDPQRTALAFACELYVPLKTSSRQAFEAAAQIVVSMAMYGSVCLQKRIYQSLLDLLHLRNLTKRWTETTWNAWIKKENAREQKEVKRKEEEARERRSPVVVPVSESDDDDVDIRKPGTRKPYAEVIVLRKAIYMRGLAEKWGYHPIAQRIMRTLDRDFVEANKNVALQRLERIKAQDLSINGDHLRDQQS
jgi:hypothetical protein